MRRCADAPVFAIRACALKGSLAEGPIPVYSIELMDKTMINRGAIGFINGELMQV